MHSRGRILGLALFCLLGLAARADNGPPIPTGPSPLTVISQDPDLQRRPHIDLPGGVTKLPAVTYSVLNGYRPLTLDLFVPKAGRAPNPIVVYIHGGGWSLDPNGDEGLSGDSGMEELARRGYLVVRPTYRLTSEAIFPAQLIDVKTAIRWAKTYAATYHGDPSRVVVWGASAGGNLAALVGTSCGQRQFDTVVPLGRFYGLSTPAIDPKVTSCVVAAIDWFGPTDFAAMASEALPGADKHNTASAPESQYLGCVIPQCPADKLAAADPITYVSKDSPPLLIMHGLADPAVPHQQSEDLYKALRAKGVPAELVLVPGASHMFMGVPPKIMRAQLDTVFRWIDRRTRAKSGPAP